MNELPSDLIEALPPSSRGAAEAWWASLSIEDRRQVAHLWDERLEVQFFDRQSDEHGEVDEWEDIPKVEGGYFVPRETDREVTWSPSYFEYLVQNTDLVLAYEPALRLFYIGCTRHQSARECLANSMVPKDFSCSVSNENCPLLNLRGASLRYRKRVCLASQKSEF